MVLLSIDDNTLQVGRVEVGTGTVNYNADNDAVTIGYMSYSAGDIDVVVEDAHVDICGVGHEIGVRNVAVHTCDGRHKYLPGDTQHFRPYCSTYRCCRADPGLGKGADCNSLRDFL